MAETQTADIQEKQSGYVKGLQGFLQSQSQPRSWMEHPATAFIPLIGGPIFAAGRLQARKRENDALIQAAEFNTMVQSGKFPEGPEGFQVGAKMGLPLPLIASGMLESQKVRATPSYQGRQLFESAMPTWNQKPREGEAPDATTQRNAAAFQAFAQQNPEVFGALGNPETGRLGLQNVYTPTMLGAMKQRGMATPSWYQGGESGQTVTQTPMETSQAPETPQVATAPRTTTPPPQDDTGLAQRAQARGRDPRTVLALKGNEGSGPQAVSPSGAYGTFQLLKDTARRYLPPAFKNMSDPELETALKDEKVNESLALDHIGDLEKKYPGRPDLVAAAYFSGEGNVENGQIKNPNLRAVDKNGKPFGPTVAQYVASFQKRYQGAQVEGGGTSGQGKAQTKALDTTTYRPFNMSGPATTAETTLAVSPSGPTLTMKDVPLADRAAAHLTTEVLRNPRNYRQAYMDLAQKGALPPEARLKEVQLQAASAIYQDHETALINQGFKPNTNGTLEQEALRRTADDMGVLSPEVSKALMDIPTRVGAVEFLRETAKNRAGTDPTADLLRERQEASAGRTAEEQRTGTNRGALSPSGNQLRETETQQRLSEEERKQRQTGRVSADMPLGQRGDEGMKIAQRYGVTPDTSLKDLSKRVLLPDDLQKEGAGIDKLVQGLDMVKRYYVATNPREKGTLLASIQGYLKGFGTGLGLNPNVKDYKEMVTAFARIMGTITTETGGKYTKEDVEQYLMAIPNEKLTMERAFPRFQAFEEMVTAPYYSRLKSYLSGEPPLMQKYRERYPEVGAGQNQGGAQGGTPGQPAGQGAPQGQAPAWDPHSGKPKVPIR